MADSQVPITSGSGTNIDSRTESTNGNHRQVVVLGDPALNDNVAAVATQDLSGSDQTTPGIVVRMAGSMSISQVNTTVTVGFDPGHELGSIKGINSTVGIYLDSTKGTIGVSLKPGTIAVSLDPGHEIGSIKGITNTIAIHHLSTGGTLAIKIDPGYNVVNISNTLVIPIVSSGSYNGVSVSGKTVAGPTSSRVLKVYGIALTTTAQVGIVAKFTNGAGTSPTEFWRYALQAPSQGIAGANLAVTPPGYLFATASGSTLSLVLDSASLVHYSVSYFEESA